MLLLNKVNLLPKWVTTLGECTFLYNPFNTIMAKTVWYARNPKGYKARFKGFFVDTP
jgi:hypothetical protein